MKETKLAKSTNLINSKKQIDKIAKDIHNTKQQDDKQKQFVYDDTIVVGDKPQTYYYNYDNEEYYFTAKNAKFQININGQIIWYYGDWIDGFFRDGLWIDGHWHNGTFCRGNWLDGKWDAGEWYKGSINGSQSEKHP